MSENDIMPWQPYKALARARLRKQERTKHSASPITDQEAHRTWKAGERATDTQVEVVFMFLEDMGQVSQDQLAKLVMELLSLNEGTARGAVTGALFDLQEMELVKWTGKFEGTEKGGRSRIWQINE